MVWSPLGPVSNVGVPNLVRVQGYPSGVVSSQPQRPASKLQLSCSESGGGGDGGGRGGEGGDGRGGDGGGGGAGGGRSVK